ncbi:MAG: hypothetical protein RLZZ312_254 [Bacteroidota bacterium]|jgi:hypothetical protein
MKIFTNLLIFIAIFMIIFNLTQLDYYNLLSDKNKIAAIGIAASFCAVLILIIFKMSKMIQEKTKNL